MRGLVWAQWYFAPEWFAYIENDDGSRCLEDDCRRQHRAARVLYLGMILAQNSNVLNYDHKTRRFSGVAVTDAADIMSNARSPCSVYARSGGDSSIESDYVLVPASYPKRSAGSTQQASVAPENDRRSSSSKVK